MTEQINPNMAIWNAVKHPPESALKQITGGRLAGKTDISPQWRYEAMTRECGPCGIGWTWEVKQKWQEPTIEGQIFVFAEVAVTYRWGETWSAPITGIGGSMLIEKEKSGLHANDEGYKMAITDALGTALKFIGVGADVYMGLHDGGKYQIVPEGDGGTTKPPVARSGASGGTAASGGAHFCQEHNVSYKEMRGKDGKSKWWSHKQGDGWCNEKPPGTTGKAITPPEGDKPPVAHPGSSGDIVKPLTEAERIKKFTDWFESLQWPDGNKLPKELISDVLGVKLGDWLKSGKTLDQAVDEIERQL